MPRACPVVLHVRCYRRKREKTVFSFLRFCSHEPNEPRGKPVGLGCHGLAPWSFTFVATGGREKRRFFLSCASVATSLTNHGASPWDWDATGLPRGASRSLLQKGERKDIFSFLRFCSDEPNEPRGKPVGLGCHGLAPWCLTFVATDRSRKTFFFLIPCSNKPNEPRGKPVGFGKEATGLPIIAITVDDRVVASCTHPRACAALRDPCRSPGPPLSVATSAPHRIGRTPHTPPPGCR